MTTKMLDSHIHLGINARKEHRIEVEKSTTCAVIRRSGFSYLLNATAENDLGLVGDTIAAYAYGPNLLNDGSTPPNYTYTYNTHSGVDQFAYGLSAFVAIAGANLVGGSYVPSPALNTTHADLSLLFISPNSITYQYPVDDPVFSAHDLVNGTMTGLYVSFYDADQFVSVVGCSEQYRICNPNNNACTQRMGFGQLSQASVDNQDGLELNAVQNSTWIRINAALQLSSVYYATYARGGSALRAGEVVTQLSSGYLPPTQWHIEVSSWFDAGLARIQQKVQEYATGPSSIVSGSFVQHPNRSLEADAPWVDFCYSQLINDSNNTVSFSVLGLAILLGLGGIIIISSLVIDTIVGYIQLWSGRGLHARMEWITGDKLQMQRLLLREMRIGQWNDDVTQKIPTTTGRDQVFSGVADRQLNESIQLQQAHGEEDVQFINEPYQGKVAY